MKYMLLFMSPFNLVMLAGRYAVVDVLRGKKEEDDGVGGGGGRRQGGRGRGGRRGGRGIVWPGLRRVGGTWAVIGTRAGSLDNNKNHN